MRNLRIAVLVLACFSACGTVPNATCGLDAATRTTFRTLLSREWSKTTPETVAGIWPSSVLWGAEAAGDKPCSGTATFSNLARVVANECLCCDTFAFTDVSHDSKCERHLSSVTLVRHVADEARARDVATQLLAVVDGTRQLVLPSTTVTRQLSPTSTEVTQLEVTRALGGWRIRLLTYRVSADEQ